MLDTAEGNIMTLKTQEYKPFKIKQEKKKNQKKETKKKKKKKERTKEQLKATSNTCNWSPRSRKEVRGEKYLKT